jgi:hypothetical protein
VILLIALIAAGSLRGGLSCSYITKVEHLVGLPVGVVFLKPSIEFAAPFGNIGEFGGIIEDFYVSLDCVEDDSSLVIELGANCARVGPSYRAHIRDFEITGSAGYLRIDVAALVTGNAGGFVYAGQIDEERDGGFLGLKLRYKIANMFRIDPFLSFGLVGDGSFWELGSVAAFKPFTKRDSPGLLRGLAFTAGISAARLAVALEDDPEPYDVKFIYYLVGLDYELGFHGESAEKSGNKEGHGEK